MLLAPYPSNIRRIFPEATHYVINLGKVVIVTIGLFLHTEAYSACPEGAIDITDSPYSATADDDTDDRAAIMAAQDDCAGGTICFPEGQYDLTGTALVLEESNCRWYGDGEAVLNRKETVGHIIQTSVTSASLKNISFEGLTFRSDITGTIHGLLLQHELSGIRVTNCSFESIPSRGISLASVSNVVIEDSSFSDDGEYTGTGVFIGTQSGGSSPSKIVIRNNTFRYLDSGIIVDADTGESETASDITIEGNLLDMGWFTGKALHTGTAETFSSTSLDDTAGGFTDLSLSGSAAHTVLVLPTRESSDGTDVLYITRSGKPRVYDPSATFVANGAIRGDLLRVSGKFALVESVDSETMLTLEEWIDSTSYALASEPADETAYTLYRIIIGHLDAVTDADTLDVSYSSSETWFDLEGTHSIDPADGTAYEILPARGDYPIHIEPGASGVIIRNNTIKRGWSDCISAFSSKNQILNNNISFCQDMCITFHGTGDPDEPNIVQSNSAFRCGVSCIWTRASGDYSSIVDNHCTDPQWVNTANDNAAGIMVSASSEDITGLYLARNTVVDQSVVTTTNGVTLLASGEGSVLDQVMVEDNSVSGVSGTPFLIAEVSSGDVATVFEKGNSSPFE